MCLSRKCSVSFHQAVWIAFSESGELSAELAKSWRNPSLRCGRKNRQPTWTNSRCLYFSIFRNLAFSCPKDTQLNPLDKGKSFSRARNRPLFQDINLLVDLPESCVDLPSSRVAAESRSERL